ncbi:Rho GDP-dissociation inhibitor [Cyphellophora attinorum]|uniref:Rho GDP-dissociation inhibitor n=1 Tax=Cyphellophora attinorum TaxID=1664694 RepID=A0A0N1NXT1_9EURO|nr:Rho GDP-dissociation inhibitor [Phialophora attinorum]KPI38657.1 Rho GDP-dissociation inhibitor [Phialophora attinorum]
MADDLKVEGTPGFKVGEKKTIDEYQKLDQEDEALNRWKASLGLGQGQTVADPNDPRLCVIKSLALEVAGRPDITIDLSAPGAVESLRSKPFTIKEGCTYEMKASFVVQHQVLSGLKYVQQLKRKGIPLGKDQEMIGSYSPNTTDRPTYTKKFAPEEAPKGMMARGHYEAVSKFIDDDNTEHLKFEWSFDIAKDWK